MLHPQPHPHANRVRVLFVTAWLVGGEETEIRLLARNLPRDRTRIDVIPCFRKEGMPEQTHEQLRDLGVVVDTTAYEMSFEDTVAYLARRIPHYDVVVACRNVPDVYPALERLRLHPPLVEHGGLVSEALGGPKHLTARYVGVCDTIRAAAASVMPGREHHAVEIPSMVDLAEFRPERRGPVRRALGIGPDELLVGWVGRLDRKKRVEDFLDAAALVAPREPRARFVVVGGPDAFMPEYADELRARAAGLGGRVAFLGDRADVPDLLAAMDAFCWLSRGEGMPHVIAEAGAAGLPVVATPDDGALQQVRDGETGLVVPHEDPPAVADAVGRLLGDAGLRARLGRGLRAHVERTYAAEVVVPRWERLLDEVIAEVPPAPRPGVFRSFVQGGWECSTHRPRHRAARLDVIAANGHDRNAENDYRQLGGLGIGTVRDGLRWHLIERAPGRYDWRGWTPMLRAAARTGTQVVWDLLHYGWPDGLDVWSPAWVDRFRRFARAAAMHRRSLSDEAPFWCPVNEISFQSWLGGDVGHIDPHARGRGLELKCQLARASIAAMEELRAVDPRARFVHCEPLIAIHHSPRTGRPRVEAERYNEAQFEALDLLAGRMWPQLGGREEFLDVVGLNYYFNNQWIHEGGAIDVDHEGYWPLSDLLYTVHARYGRPILISETGIEGDRRAAWFAYVAAEAERARARGVPVEGICLYPIADHPGWDDDRECPNGLLGMRVGADGRRAVHAPLAEALAEARARWRLRPPGEAPDEAADRARPKVA